MSATSRRAAAVGIVLTAVCGCGLGPAPGLASPPASEPPARGEPVVAATPGAELRLTFADAPATGRTISATVDRGRVPSTIRVQGVDGARVTSSRGPAGPAARFPQAHGVGRAALVALVDDPDALSPGDRDFSYGADVVLDATSEASGDKGDNGDNVIQRGLYTDAAQYKLQLDHGRPACRVAGRGGAAYVAAATKVVRGRWYRLVCARRGDALRLRVRPWRGSAWGAGRTWSTSSPVHEVSFAASEGNRASLSVGAKVGRNGRIPTDSDQLNGAVDNVFVDVE